MFTPSGQSNTIVTDLYVRMLVIVSLHITGSPTSNYIYYLRQYLFDPSA